MREYNNHNYDDVDSINHWLNTDYYPNKQIDAFLQQFTIEEIIDRIGIEKVENVIRLKKIKRIVG